MAVIITVLWHSYNFMGMNNKGETMTTYKTIEEKLIELADKSAQASHNVSEVENQAIDTEVALCDLSEEIDSRITDIEVALCDLSEIESEK